ncbi:unnamed protein product [Microthlaspi erraticum]|uniref:Uncharacterized protein n=1 Tax=Microthlaspi erraticum TaxID=1685480 RepID=A0A6D2ICD1_9BRAS|nr:unnamed protein product [Microthlaspi erraticum]
MKTNAISFLLVVVATFVVVVVVVADVNQKVYDADGEPIKTNVPYFVSFMTLEYGMWICRMNMGADPMSCPQQPVMFTDPNIAPTPIMFVLPSSSSLSNSSDVNVVHESTEVSIKFASRDRCSESGFWRVVQNNTSSQGEVVLTGSKSSSDSTFTIEKPNEYYTFIFGSNDDRTTISISNGPISRLISTRFSGEMEVYFYRATF